MNWSGMPSLNSLRAFSAVAETGSFARAAARLNVTQAAVSQQVRALERRLDVVLIERAGRGIVLSPEGESLARDLEAGFGAIRRGVDALGGGKDARPVQITMSPAFAVEWLMPRIPAFQQRHPEITLLLNPTADVVEVRPGGIDVAIRYRNLDRADKHVRTVLISDMVVIGAPSLLKDRQRGDPTEMTKLPWLQELTTNEVAEWFRRHDVPLDRPLMVSEMPGHLIMQAVRRGDGITYTARAFFRDDIRTGRVVVLSSEPAAGYYCIETCPGAVRPAVGKVLNWLDGMAEIVTDAGPATARE